MVKAWHAVTVIFGLLAVSASFTTPVEAQLNPFFYFETCPQVYYLVAKGVYESILQKERNAAFLLRLHFHDCFVQGCDASILLDSTASVVSEQLSNPNRNSIGGIDVIDTIKAEVESSCPGIVSCADVVTLGAFFSVVLSGGPTWAVPLGRRDAFTSPDTSGLGSPLPSAFSNFTLLQTKFHGQNLTDQDMVVLSGGHTIGLSRCVSIWPRIYNFTTPPGPDPTINSTLLSSLEKICPLGGDGNVTTVMDLKTPTIFDNQYYKEILKGNGLFQTDQDLLDRGTNETNALVKLYASNQDQFFEDFAASMINMGNIQVLTGTEGEIRLNCSVRNPVSSVIEQVVNSDSERKSKKPTTERKRRSAGRADTPKSTEKFKGFVQQVLKQVAEDLAAEQREGLVDMSGHYSPHYSM